MSQVNTCSVPLGSIVCLYQSETLTPRYFQRRLIYVYRSIESTLKINNRNVRSYDDCVEVSIESQTINLLT